MLQHWRFYTQEEKRLRACAQQVQQRQQQRALRIFFQQMVSAAAKGQQLGVAAAAVEQRHRRLLLRTFWSHWFSLSRYAKAASALLQHFFMLQQIRQLSETSAARAPTALVAPLLWPVRAN